MLSLRVLARIVASRVMPVFLTAALLLPAVGSAQLPEPLPLPNLKLWTNGGVKAIARAPDGSIVFGGDFLAVNGVPRGHLARLLPNGALDPDWNPRANSSVNAIVIDVDGSIFVGGFFTEVGGQSRDRIAKLLPFGAGIADIDWNPGANDSVDALALDTHGGLFVGGTFTMIADVARGRLAKLEASSPATADPFWDPNVGGSVLVLAYDAFDDALFVGGEFSVIGVTPRASIAKIEASGAGAAVSDWNPGADGAVTSLQIDAFGNLYAGGSFSNFANQAHARVARVDRATGIGDLSWAPVIAGGDVRSLALDGNRIYLGGSFTDVGALLQPSLARVSTLDGAADANFDPVINGAVLQVVSFGGGVVHIGGSQFTDIDGNVRLGFAALNNSGAVLAANDVMRQGSVYALARLPDGSMLVGGNFYFADVSSRRNLLKLDANGLLDPQWQPTTDGFVFGLTLDATGSAVYTVGSFLNVYSEPRASLAKLATSGIGALHESWNPMPDGDVNTVAVASDDSVYVGGTFTQIAGAARDNIAKLSGAAAAIDAGWNSVGADGDVGTLAVAPDGSVFASGAFGAINGQVRAGLAKLDAVSGAADPGWSADLNNQRFARSIVFANDSLYIGGGFSSVDNVARGHLAKISIAAPGVVDPLWNPNANAEVEVVVLGTDNIMFVAGGFTSIDGVTHRNLAKLSTLGGGALDSTWAPTVLGSYLGTLAFDATGNLVVGGFFQQIGTQLRQSLAALPTATPLLDELFNDSFE